jgi:CRP/FNR family transcriptional regulator, cyclic AMP receptor protein
MFRRRDTKRSWVAERTQLDRLHRSDLDTLAATADRVVVPAGRVLAHRGQFGREAFLVVRGELRVERDGELVATVGPGELVGELALLGDWHRTADVVTTTEAELAVFSRRAFEAAMAGSPSFRHHVEDTVARRADAA